MKVCVSNNTSGFRSICSKGTPTGLCVISIKVQESGQMNTELWYVDRQGGERPFRGINEDQSPAKGDIEIYMAAGCVDESSLGHK